VVELAEHLGRRQLTRARNFGDFILSQTDYDVLRFEVGVDNFAHAMHVIQANQTLSRKLASQGHGHSLVIVSFDDLKEVNTKNFEHHNEVFAIGSMMDKGV
jgi:hypothetical protein